MYGYILAGCIDFSIGVATLAIVAAYREDALLKLKDAEIEALRNYIRVSKDGE